MNKRRQSMQKQNMKIAKKKLSNGNGEGNGGGFGFIDMLAARARNEKAINDIKNMDVSLTNPWVRSNPLSLSNRVPNNLNNVSNIDPAVLVNSPQVVSSPAKKPKPKNPTLGFQAGSTPGRGQNLRLNFNTNQGGRGVNLSTNTNFNDPNSQSNKILDNSSVTLSGNQIPLSLTVGGDGSVSAGGNFSLNQLRNKAKANKNRRKKD